MIGKIRYWFINVPRQRKENRILRERLYIGPAQYVHRRIR